MRTPIQNLVCVLAIAAIGWLAFGNLQSTGQVGARQQRVRWEYRIEESTKSVVLLNQCGNEGWELVEAMQFAHEGDQVIYQYVFKRPR